MARARPSDRVSGLPDELLLKILSLLPDTRLAFQTSVLSTRWRRLPSHCPVIRLPFLNHGNKPTKRYTRTVDGCLRSLRAPTLHYLQIDLPYSKRYMHTVDRWIRFAGERSVRELHLSPICYYGRTYYAGPSSPSGPCIIRSVVRIPCSIFSSHLPLSLTSLHLDCCNFGTIPYSFQGFSLLRELSISNFMIGDQDLAQLLQHCAVLENLQLIDCSSCNVLRLDPARVPKLKHLRILKPHRWEPNVMVVEAPALRSLSVEGCFTDIVLKGCLLLADVQIYGYLRNSVKYHSEISLLSSVSMVDRISVDDWIFQVDFLRNHSPTNPVSVFKNLKKLCCDVNCVTESMLGAFPSILEECPLLGELRVKIKGHAKVFQSDRRNEPVIEYCHSQQSWLKTSSEFTLNKLNSYDDPEQDGGGSLELYQGIRKMSHQLKYAVVQGFLGSKNESQLLQFLLRQATALEKLVVSGFHFQFYEQTMIQELLSHLREGCPRVQIMHQFQ